MKLPEGKEFGELNYRLYGRRPLVCPKCGFQEHSDYDHHGACYYFRNFVSLGRIVQADQGAETSEASRGNNSAAKKD